VNLFASYLLSNAGKHLKTSLNEMLIEGEGNSERSLLHHYKGNAINQPPILNERGIQKKWGYWQVFSPFKY
jgi:hypothetical protein